jgi:hypothetical protein
MPTAYRLIPRRRAPSRPARPRRAALASEASCSCRSARTTTIRLLWTSAAGGALAALRHRYQRDLQQDAAHTVKVPRRRGFGGSHGGR